MKTHILVTLLLFSIAARADEIRLKDGSKIIGTIVGFQDDSFKVQTSYGFAMVRKDQIVEIIPSTPKQPPPKDKDSAAVGSNSGASSAASSPPTSAAASGPATDVAATPANDSHAISAPTAPAKPAPHATASPTASHRAAAPAPTATAPAPTPAVAPSATPTATVAVTQPVAAAAPESKPEPIREEIVGNLYINRTYGFDIYKPPDWELLPDEMHSLPNAVAAMGTDDDTSLLLIGREARKGALDAQAAATDEQLHNIYDNFRLLSDTHTTLAGEPAIERHFRGSAADRDWSVTVVTVAHGQDLFTLLGMTYADTDLIQIQENVIARAVASLRFETP